jgi:hypothetical protein
VPRATTDADASVLIAEVAVEAPDASVPEAVAVVQPEPPPVAVAPEPASGELTEWPEPIAGAFQGFMTPAQRVQSGRNYPMVAVQESPLQAVVPSRLIPAAATLLTVGAMSIWPFIWKTITGLLKKILAGYIKQRGKKDKKLEKPRVEFALFGFRFGPAELFAVLVGAVVYTAAICYAFTGLKWTTDIVVEQLVLVTGLSYLRSFTRIVYGRVSGVATQFKFWPGGGVFCLVSAYFGNTLGTVGYELESAKGKEAQALRLKAWLVVVSLVLGLAFFAGNLVYPAKFLQSGRVMSSGMALGDILPLAPMAGQKIFGWSKGLWSLLFGLIISTYFVINFFL